MEREVKKEKQTFCVPPNWLSDKYLVRYFSHRNSRQIPSKKADVSSQRRWGKLWAMLARAFEVAVHPRVVVVILLQVRYQNHVEFLLSFLSLTVLCQSETIPAFKTNVVPEQKLFRWNKEGLFRQIDEKKPSRLCSQRRSYLY